MLFILDGVSNFCENTVQIWVLVGNVVKIIQIVIPVMLVLWGALDIGKAVMAGEEKEIKEAQGLLIKRVIWAVVIAFIFIIVKGLMGLVNTNDEVTSYKCWKCVEKPKSADCRS